MIGTKNITTETKNILGEFIGISELEKRFWYNFNRIIKDGNNDKGGKSPLKLIEKEIKEAILNKLEEMKIHEIVFEDGLEKHKGTELGSLCLLYVKLRTDQLKISNGFLNKYINNALI